MKVCVSILFASRIPQLCQLVEESSLYIGLARDKRCFLYANFKALALCRLDTKALLKKVRQGYKLNKQFLLTTCG